MQLVDVVVSFVQVLAVSCVEQCQIGLETGNVMLARQVSVQIALEYPQRRVGAERISPEGGDQIGVGFRLEHIQRMPQARCCSNACVLVF